MRTKNLSFLLVSGWQCCQTRMRQNPSFRCPSRSRARGLPKHIQTNRVSHRQWEWLGRCQAGHIVVYVPYGWPHWSNQLLKSLEKTFSKNEKYSQSINTSFCILYMQQHQQCMYRQSLYLGQSPVLLTVYNITNKKIIVDFSKLNNLEGQFCYLLFILYVFTRPRTQGFFQNGGTECNSKFHTRKMNRPHNFIFPFSSSETGTCGKNCFLLANNLSTACWVLQAAVFCAPPFQHTIENEFVSACTGQTSFFYISGASWSRDAFFNASFGQL